MKGSFWGYLYTKSTHGHQHRSNYSSLTVLCSSDVVTCKTSAKSCTWSGTIVMSQSRGQVLETHLECQIFLQPHPPSTAGVLHRSGPRRNINQQNWVLNNTRILLLEGNSSVQDVKSPQSLPGWTMSRPRLLSSPGTALDSATSLIAAGSWVSSRDEKIDDLLSVHYWNC